MRSLLLKNAASSVGFEFSQVNKKNRRSQSEPPFRDRGSVFDRYAELNYQESCYGSIRLPYRVKAVKTALYCPNLKRPRILSVLYKKVKKKIARARSVRERGENLFQDCGKSHFPRSRKRLRGNAWSFFPLFLAQVYLLTRIAYYNKRCVCHVSKIEFVAAPALLEHRREAGRLSILD